MMHYNHAKTQGHHNPKPFILGPASPAKKITAETATVMVTVVIVTVLLVEVVIVTWV